MGCGASHSTQVHSSRQPVPLRPPEAMKSQQDVVYIQSHSTHYPMPQSYPAPVRHASPHPVPAQPCGYQQPSYATQAPTYQQQTQQQPALHTLTTLQASSVSLHTDASHDNQRTQHSSDSEDSDGELPKRTGRSSKVVIVLV